MSEEEIIEEKESIKILESYTTDLFHNYKGEVILKAIRNLIKGYKELEEYQHKVNEILNLDDDNLDVVLVDNCHKGLKKCVTEFEKENHYKTEMINYLDKRRIEDFEFYLETLNNTIPKSKLKEKIEKYAHTTTDDEENIINFYNEIRELLHEGDK